jgi:hypothetical protein
MILSTLALVFVSFTQNANASWRMDSANLLTARMDPLVSPNAVTVVSSISFLRFVRYATPDALPASMFTT